MASKHRPKMKPELRVQIFRRDNWTCQHCGLVFPSENCESSAGRYSPTRDGRGLEIDHRVPYSRGGTNDPENLRALCDLCNRRKLAKTHEMFWPERIAEVVRYLERREPSKHVAERAAEILLGEFHTAIGPMQRARVGNYDEPAEVV